MSIGRNIFRGIIKGLAYFFFRPTVEYADKSIKDLKGPVIFICNHTSHYDGAMVSAVLSKWQSCILIAKDWADKKNVGALFRLYGSVPVNRREMDTEWFFEAQKRMESGESFLIFPEGKTSKGEMNDFQPGFAILAEKMNAPIVTCAVYGRYKFVFGPRMHMVVGGRYEAECPPDLRKSIYARQLAKDMQGEVQQLKNRLAAEYGEKLAETAQ